MSQYRGTHASSISCLTKNRCPRVGTAEVGMGFVAAEGMAVAPPLTSLVGRNDNNRSAVPLECIALIVCHPQPYEGGTHQSQWTTRAMHCRSSSDLRSLR